MSERTSTSTLLRQSRNILYDLFTLLVAYIFLPAIFLIGLPIGLLWRLLPYSWRGRIFPLLMIAPAIIAILVIILYPLGYSIYISLTPMNLLRYQETLKIYDDTLKPTNAILVESFSNLVWDQKIVFDPFLETRHPLYNYETLREDEIFKKSVRNTILFLAITVNTEFILALFLSQLMARATWGQSILRTILMVPMMFAPVLVGFQFAWFFNATVGLVNNGLTELGLMSEPKAWLIDKPSGMISLMLASIWMNVPVMTIILLAGTLSLPSEVYEAAEVDGAGYWQQFFHITFPLLRPFTLIALTVRSLDIGRAFDIVMMMTGGGPANRTEMIWTYAGRLAVRSNRYGLASAVSMIGVFLGILFTLYLFRQLIKSRVVY